MSCKLKTKEQISKEKLACVRDRTFPQKWNDNTCTCERIKREKNKSGDTGFYKKNTKTLTGDTGFYK
jgi:hypothetical protein